MFILLNFEVLDHLLKVENREENVDISPVLSFICIDVYCYR
jgi:hypothetical protein